jgi:hypothetical protein
MLEIRKALNRVVSEENGNRGGYPTGFKGK